MDSRLQQEEEFDLQNMLGKIKEYRGLFLSSVIVCLVITFFYNRYATPIYNVKASILIDEEENMSETAELIYGADLLSSNKSLFNEIAILKSYPFIYRTVKSLNKRVTYFREGRIGNGELYNNLPFEVFVDSLQHNTQNEGIPLFVTILNEKKFLLEASWNDKMQLEKELSFDEPFLINGTLLTINLKQDVESLGEKFFFRINNFEQLARTYKSKLSIYPYSKESSVIDISLETSVPQKEIDFLNELTYQYTIVSLEDKNQSTSQSLSFINEQLEKTFDTLQVIENALEDFKSRNGFSQASGMLERSFDKISTLESEKAALLINKQYYQAIQQYLEENRAIDELVAPSSLGVQDVLLNNLINQLATLQIEKNTYLIEGPAKNPYIKEVEGKINNIKATLRESLQNMIENNHISLSQINHRIATVENEISALPEAERKYINIKRLYDLNENIYNLLLQKKVEAGITQASATVDNKVIEPAYLVNTQPIQPRKSRNYIISIFIGMLLPAACIFLKEKFSTTVKNKTDIEKYTDLSVIGSISQNEKNLPLVVHQSPKSPTAESFRVLRSNLKYAARNQEVNKTFLITSMISGEGKTFCSINLAIALALSGKKTLLLDSDMRKDQPVSDLGLDKNCKGLSNYLVGDTSLDEIIQKSPVNNLEVIASGPIPPNPAELLMEDSMEVMMDVLKSSYEFIVIDTSPIGLVTDAQIMMSYSHANLFIIRQKFTQKESLKLLADMKEQNAISNASVVFNDVNTTLGYYGYGYYIYPQKKPSLLKSIKAIF
uniref:non-specific protein-tyrosine kinase n=2 Tax=Roseihalotalea indica TaxID=2867963 RepID=A0AA49GIK1_9BACT|nr:polysaccharide biosynthesis tyrosine autokinase [Tunicatimonas sp. TK19036]